MSKQQIRKWLRQNGYLYGGDNEYYRGDGRCRCRFRLGHRHLLYEVSIDGRWVVSQEASLAVLSLDDKNRLKGLSLGLFSI